jgi:thymidylate kinase
MENDELYVDKTMFCKIFVHFESPKCCYRPSKYGKSLFISMLINFFDISERIPKERRRKQFEKCRIYKEDREFFDKHFAKYPIISLSFEVCK